MSDDDSPVVLPLVVAFSVLAGVAFLMDSQDEPGSSTALTAPATASVTAPITNTNTITITNEVPVAVPVANGIVGTSSVALVLGVILAVGLVAAITGAAAAFLLGAQGGGRRGIGRSGEYDYSPLAHEPRRWSR